MQFHTKLAGVTHDGRQGIIRNLHRIGELDTGTELVLKREANNRYDSFAVAVLTKDGQSIGYIPKDTARQISINMNSGMTYHAYVSAVTGGDAGYAYGVNLRIEYDDSHTESETIIEPEDTYSQYKETKATRVYNLFVNALDSQSNFRFSKDPNRLCNKI